MKKTWLFGMAFTLGLSTLPSVSSAQYASSPFGNGALAPSGYAVNETYGQTPVYPSLSVSPQSAYGQQAVYGQQSGNGQVQVQAQPPAVQIYQGQSQFPQATGQSSVAAQMVGYPQELVAPPAPAYEAQQAPEQGWVGPNNGQYQPQPVPAPSANGHAQQAGNGYSSILAPTAMDPNFAAGNCASGACGEAVYPNVLGPMTPGWMASRTAVPGKAYFAGGGALLFRRVDDHNVALSYNTAMPSENTLGTGDARQTRLPGFEVFLGRYFNCGRNAVVASYWGLFPDSETATIQAGAYPSSYRSRYQFNGINMPSQNAYDWYDGSISHRITRSSQYHNVEANVLGFALGGAARTWNAGGSGDCNSCGGGCAAFTGPCGLAPSACGSRLNLTWLGGFRWFRFKDNLQYAASEQDYNYNGGTDDLYYDNNVVNDLVGFQLGAAGTYCCTKRCNLYAISKAGIYNNHSTLYTRIGRNGAMPTTAVVNSANIYNGQEYMVDASQNNAAFLGEIGTGVGVRVSKCFSANIGYRVLGASGVATAVNTIPIEMLHLGNVADYNTTSSVLLHGVTLGGMYNF